MWKLMATAYPLHFKKISPSYHLHAKASKKPLKQYFELLNSNTCDWRAILSFSTHSTDVTDLVAIGNLKNLVALEIYQINGSSRLANRLEVSESVENNELHDGIVRSWIEMAESLGTLQHLRILRLHNHKRLKISTLSLLKALPQLQLIIAYD